MASSVSKSTHCQWCSAVNCSNSRNNRPDLAFFRFPKDQERSKRWVINCSRADLEGKPADALHRGSVLCQEHFEPLWFGKSAVRKRLLPHAVPTVFSIPNPPPGTALSRPPPRERPPVTETSSCSAVNDHLIMENTEATVNVSCDGNIRSMLKRKLNAERSETWRLKAVGSKECDASVKKDTEKEMTTEAQDFDKMDRELLADIKIEQPEEDVEYLGQEIMESYNLLPENEIKLEPACETDHVHSSAKVMVIEAHAFDEMDIESPASVKEEPPEDVEYSNQETPASSLNCCYPSAEEQLEKPELSGVLYKDKHQMFTKVIDVAGCSSDPGMTRQNNTVSRVIGNSHKSSLEHKNCSQISQNVSSVFAVNTKISLTDKNCHLQNDMGVKKGDRPSMADVCDPEVSVDGCLSGDERTDTDEESLKNDLCGASFTSADYLKLQRRKLAEEKPYRCEDCDARFIRSNDLKIHKRTHTGEKPYKCDDCGAFFSHSGSLKTHKRTHTGEKPYRCEDCGAEFARSGGLKRHRRTHTGERPYSCDDCGASFIESSNFLQHKRKHTGESPFKCDECGAVFTSSGTLKAHNRTHTGEKPYKCDDCGAVFTRSGGLKTHKRTHTGEKPYKCDYCGVYFSESTHLTKHKRMHTGEKPYKCDDCGAEFARSGGLKTHKRTHTGERPYKCDVCGACFTQMTHVSRHKRIHTGDKPEICDVKLLDTGEKP